MRSIYLARLAWQSLIRSRQTSIPFLLTSSLMVMIEYILFYLAGENGLVLPVGAEEVNLMLRLGSFVLAVFSLIFLFYTFAFLMRTRMKEFGLFHVLGMNRSNLALILFWQILFLALISIGGGLILGILFSKLAELVCLNLIGGIIEYSFTISFSALIFTALLFGGIYLLLWVWSVWKLARSRTISMLKAEKKAEKAPKGNWLIGLLGLGLLFTAYWMAVRIQNPLTSFILFFGLVLMVIVALYLILISGSVWLVSLLKKNKKFYYKTNRFISLSSLGFRLKRNGAGLASISILTTMILVTLSTTAALYFGSDSAIQQRYPREINIDIRLQDSAQTNPVFIASLEDQINDLLKEQNVTPKNVRSYLSASTTGYLDQGGVQLDPTGVELSLLDADSLVSFFFRPLESLPSLADTGLQENQVIAYANRGLKLPQTLDFFLGEREVESLQITEQLDTLEVELPSAVNITTSAVLFTKDLPGILSRFEGKEDQKLLSIEWVYDFDTGLDSKANEALYQTIFDFYSRNFHNWPDVRAIEVENREIEKSSNLAFYGGFFFLGLILSLIFGIGAVLIIYYKQVSEGYEDEERFEIMQKVGLNKKQIRKSIHFQLLAIFFIPLAFAILNLCFAFPMMSKLVMLFNFNDEKLFMLVSLLCTLGVSLLYTLTWWLTSQAYYSIVQKQF